MKAPFWNEDDKKMETDEYRNHEKKVLGLVGPMGGSAEETQD